MVKLVIETAIRRVSWATAQVGRKSLHEIEVDLHASTVTQSFRTGTTSFCTFTLPSARDDFRIIRPRFTGGGAFFRAKGQTASAVRLMPDIDYYFDFEVYPHEFYLSGAHDGYPSYNVSVGGTSKYDYVQGHLGQLFGTCDVTVSRRRLAI